MLATKADYSKIKYPVLATPKLDGIRCLMVDGVAMSRSMKPIPNKYIREQLKGLHGLDGELMLNGDFNDVLSGIMSVDGEPDFTYHVFDSFDKPEQEYEDRIEHLDWDIPSDYDSIISLLTPIKIRNEQDLEAYLEECLANGYEGVMIRQPDSPYKFGRSTVNQGYLLKIKRFLDTEGTLLRVTEKMTNGNELEQDELGYAKRKSCKANLIPAGTAGGVVVNWQGHEVGLGFGPGITDAIKQDIWDRRKELKDELTKFSYQELSKDGIPRFGKMLSFRHKDDL